MIAAREKGFSNRHSVVAVNHEVVHFEEVAADDAENCLRFGLSNSTGRYGRYGRRKMVVQYETPPIK